MDQGTDDEAADPAQHENWKVLVRDDRVRKANQQPEQEADKPAWPARQLNAPNHKSDGETARECTKQRCCLVRERHREHETHIQCSEEYSSDQTEDAFRNDRMSN